MGVSRGEDMRHIFFLLRGVSVSTAKHTRSALYVPLVAATVTVAIGLASCGDRTGDPSSEDAAIEVSVVAEAEYVDFMAALTVALEEGLTGDAANSRVSDLGVKILDGDDIESVLDGLRRDPVHWAEIERSVDERIELHRERSRRPESE